MPLSLDFVVYEHYRNGEQLGYRTTTATYSSTNFIEHVTATTEKNTVAFETDIRQFYPTANRRRRWPVAEMG